MSEVGVLSARQVSLLSYQDVFVCRTCLVHNCSVHENLEFKRGEDVLEEVESFVIWVIWLVFMLKHMRQ